jgi:outer membrane protein
MERNMKRIYGFLIAVLLMLAYMTGSGFAQGASVLDSYVQMGLENNLALKQQVFSLEKSLQALKEAKGMFLPTVSIEACYSRAGGGRLIEFPVGDLVNPMHLSLNQLMMAHGQVAAFPANIQNVEIPFLRKEEHDTKLRITQPVFQPAIYFNAKIKKDLIHIEEAKMQAYKRQLKSDIATAYYNYFKAVELIAFLKETEKLLQENVRVSESLFKFHKRTEEVVFRSKAELSALQQQQMEADKQFQMAIAYFNFLLNRPMDSKIETMSKTAAPKIVGAGNKTLTLAQLEQHAIKHREEFRQLFKAISAANHHIKLQGSAILPNVTAVLDYGFQGDKYKFTGKEDYWMASLVFSWNLYHGGRDKAKKAQAALEKKRLEMQHLELETKIRLQVKEAFYNVNVARTAVVSSEDRLTSRKETLHIVSKKYSQGMVPQIEFIKARNDFTEASVKHIIAKFDLLIYQAQLNRAAAK